MIEKIKQNYGITLIALVVTIIVLLILAGVSISMLTGQNGILKRAAEAKEETGTAQIDEQVKLAINGALTKGLGTIGYNDLKSELDSQVGAGKYTITPESSTATSWTVTANGKEYKVDAKGTQKTQQPLPKVEGETMPYYPSSDFAKVEGTDLSTGLVIEDGAQNQYVWIEVPRTEEVYKNAKLNLDFNTLTGEDLTNAYTTVEDDLHTYTSIYRNGTSNTDEYDSDEQTGLTETQYNDLKKTMLKSVYENGGFWIGRYETGIEDSYRDYGSDRATEHPINEKPVIKANAYPYTWVRCSQAQTLASRFSGSGYTSSLMYGVQWDLVLKYLETKAVEKGAEIATIQSELNSNSISWGNYNHNTYNITNNLAKYSLYYGSSWTNTPYNKESSGSILLTTGASNTFSKQNIYDLAGNVWEWTLEYSTSIYGPCISRGGDFGYCGSDLPASNRYNLWTTSSDSHYRFPCCTL